MLKVFIHFRLLMLWNQFTFPSFGFRTVEDVNKLTDQVLSDDTDEFICAYNSLHIANIKNRLPKPMLFTYYVLDYVLNDNKQDLLHSIKDFDKLFWTDQDLPKKFTPQTNYEKLSDDEFTEFIDFKFNFLKKHYWSHVKEYPQQMKESALKSFITFMNMTDPNEIKNKRFVYRDLLLFIIPYFMKEMLYSENPFDLPFNDHKQQIFEFVHKVSNNQPVLLEQMKDILMQNQSAPFLQRFNEMFPKIQNYESPSINKTGNWDPTPIGFVYGKEPTDLTLKSSQVCEIVL